MQASSSASERANSFKNLRQFRGRTVVLVFSNQGLGNLVNTAIILALMAITGQYGPKYSTSECPVPSHIPKPSDAAFYREGLSNAVDTAIILAFLGIIRQYGPKYSTSECSVILWPALELSDAASNQS